MDFVKDQRVFVEGDVSKICAADNIARISSAATVVNVPAPDDDYVLLSVDEIGGVRNAWVYIRKDSVRAMDEDQKRKKECEPLTSDMNSCQYVEGVRCEKAGAKCKKCGWNPAVAKRRQEKRNGEKVSAQGA